MKNKINKNIFKKDKNTETIITLIHERITYIQDIIRNTIISIQYYKNVEIFSNSDMILCISVLNELYEKTLSIVQNTTENVDLLIDELQKIIDKLATILCGFGTKNIDDLLFICFDNVFKNTKIEDTILNSKYELIKKYVHPVGYKIIHWKPSNPYKKKIHFSYYCEDKITEDTLILEQSNHLECFDIDSNVKSFYYKINGLKIIIQNEKLQKTLIVSCIVDDIYLDFFSNEYVNYRKKHIIDNIPENDTNDIEIIKRILNSMSLKDILIYGNNDIYKKKISIMNDVNFIKHNKLDNTIKKFLEMEIISQRNMLINLLIYDKEEDIKYIMYLLYDLITVNNDAIDSSEQKKIYDSFPWKIRIYFKDAMKLTIQYTQDMLSKHDINKVSLEQQIYLLKATENVKEKAMIKLKEIKSKGDESSMKAKQYLEGLLKIPFGIYTKEPILKILNEINQKFLSIINKYEFCNIEKKDIYSNIEISNNIVSIQKKIKDDFINNISSIIKISNNKQLTTCIQYIKSSISNIDNNEFSNQTTKHKKIEQLVNIINKYYNDNNALSFYKMYTMLNTDNNYQSLAKIPDEIKEIKHNIHFINDSLKSISSILDNSIHGHLHAKNQILKIIGQWMTGEQNGYCFGFEGSPGVGKTSLAKKGLSNCLKDENGISRPFSFIALGGSCNGSTLEGHSYTYVNSTWGRIVDILMETKCMNPIIYIDELDKVSKTEHGKEIIGILTHLIDTTQNDGFQDKYFSGIDIDLSKALFIFSYNDPEQIDRILLDRIHRIKFDNLTLDDKLIIVEKHLLPDINKKMGFSNTVILNNDIIEYIIEKYTLEPGVRKLKEVLFDLYGEINIELLKCENPDLKIPMVLSKEDIENKYLKDYHKIEYKQIHAENKIGIINGLWANSLGKGGILPIETIFFPSSSFLELKLTGLQGDVMKESMNVAKSLAWNLTDEKRKKELLSFFENTKSQGLHIHCPEGSVSKDGPSAGTAITTAIYSLFNNKKIKNNIAITGEINLQGDITAIGGLEMKILGGIRAGIKTFLYPEENKNDFIKIQNKFKEKTILENIEFVQVKYIKEVFDYVFE